MNRRLLNWAWVLVVALTLTLYAANLFLGEVNQDEGWYMYAARLVAEGQLPYVDFAFTQGPVMTYVYAMAWPLVQRWGLAAGRVFTITLGLAGMACAVLLAYRLVRNGSDGQNAADGRGHLAALLAAALVGVNVYQSYFTTAVKTYALAALWLTAGCLALTYIARRRHWPAVVAGILLALATATRSSVGIALPLVCAILFIRDRRVGRDAVSGAGEGPLRRSWFWFALGAGLTGLAIFLPYVFKSPKPFWFCLVEYHTGREPGGGLAGLIHKAGFVSRMVRAYFVACGLAVTVAIWRLLASDEKRRDKAGNHGVDPVLWTALGAITLVHLAAPFPYDDYQVVLYPVCASLLAAAVARVCAVRFLPAVAVVVVLLSGAGAFSSERNQEWFVAGRDRVWWPLRERGALASVQRVGGVLREVSKAGDELLTTDAYLAVEAGLRLPRGLELGPFSYFPDMLKNDAIERHVLNRELLTELLATSHAPVAALSGWSFAISLPTVTRVPEVERQAMLDLVRARYEPYAEAGVVGQADTPVRILKLRGAP